MQKQHMKEVQLILKKIVLFYNPIQWSIWERIPKKALIITLVTYQN